MMTLADQGQIETSMSFFLRYPSLHVYIIHVKAKRINKLIEEMEIAMHIVHPCNNSYLSPPPPPAVVYCFEAGEPF